MAVGIAVAALVFCAIHSPACKGDEILFGVKSTDNPKYTYTVQEGTWGRVRDVSISVDPKVTGVNLGGDNSIFLYPPFD